MKLSEYARLHPKATVNLFFKNEQGEATLRLPIDKALNPNRSMRYFPPTNVSAAELGWNSPYFYAEEIVGWSP